MPWVGGNRFLSRVEMEMNATYIYEWLFPLGWSINAISGMLGNMQTESTINPSIWQNLDAGNLSLGYGLVQWTPATKFLNWCASNGLDQLDMDSNLLRIGYEIENNLQWNVSNSYPISFIDFKTSTLPPYILGMTFLYNYEQPDDLNQPNRGTQSEDWYTFLTGLPPPKPITKRKKLPIYFYLKQL